MSKAKRNESVENFKSMCRNELNYLLTEFGFQEDHTPAGEFENEFKIRFIRPDLTVTAEGIHHGSEAVVYLNDPPGRMIFPRLLDPDFVPLQEQSPQSVSQGQAADIKMEARLLYQYGLDLLKGDFSVFERAVEKERAAWAEYEHRRAFGVAEQEAVAAFNNQEWSKVVEALEPYADKISPRMAKKLNSAREHLRAGTPDPE